MASTDDFAYVVDGDSNLLYKRQLGGGVSGYVHEACSVHEINNSDCGIDLRHLKTIRIHFLNSSQLNSLSRGNCFISLGLPERRLKEKLEQSLNCVDLRAIVIL